MNITLDEHHIYRIAGEIKPGVSQIIDHAGLIPDWCKQEFAAQKGTAIHEGSRLLLQHRLDWDSVDLRILPYLKSLDLFIRTTGLMATTIEHPDYHHLGYCGTWDMTGVFLMSVNHAIWCDLDDDWLIDVKSGAPAKWHRLQSSGYQK